MTPDGGTDATTDTSPMGDSAPADASSDGGIDAAPDVAPLPDGSLAWFRHFGINDGFNDIAINPTNGTYVAGGLYQSDPDAGNQVHLDSAHVGPSTLADVLLATLSATNGTALSAFSATTSFNSTTVSCTSPSPFNQDVINSVAVDGAGNVYVAGTSTSAAINLQTAVTAPAAFVAQVSGAGTYQWQHVYTVDGAAVNGPTDTGSTMNLTVAGGHLIVAFGWSGTLTYDSGQTIPSGAGADVFVSALDPSSGNTVWQVTFGSGSDNLNQVTTGDNGNIYMAGTMRGTMTGLTGPGFPVNIVGDAGTPSDAFVVELDTSGKPVMSLAYGDPTNSGYTAMESVASAGGTLAMGGYFGSTVDFGKGAVTNQGSLDGFVIGYDEAKHTTKFVQILAGMATNAINAVAVDAWGEVFAIGAYGRDGATALLGTTPLVQAPANTAGLVLAKWDATGNTLWTHSVVPSAPDGGTLNATMEEILTPTRVRATPTGQVVAAGWMSGGADFGGGYAGLLSTIVYRYCHTFKFCTCTNGPPIDGWVGVWQP